VVEHHLRQSAISSHYVSASAERLPKIGARDTIASALLLPVIISLLIVVRE
jgi:hypothetical protein